ncbi:MAG: hypothetical protein ACOCWV_01180 [Planctomycetota bacterium]
MRLTRLTAAVLSVALASTLAVAQVPGVPRKATVLSEIPSGVMGFAVINDLKTTSTKVDAFIRQIGLGQMANQAMPDGVLKMIVKEARLGDGFTGEGDVAIAMLNPKDVGMDFSKLVEERMNTMMGDGGQQPPKEVQLPFVVWLPGKSIESVFPKKDYNPTKKGAFTELSLPTGKMLAMEKGKYVILSPNAEALTVVKKSKLGVLKDLRNDHALEILRTEIGIHMDMKVAGPILNDIIKTFEKFIQKQKEAGGGGMGMMMMGPMAMMDKIMPTYRDLLEQVSAVTVTGKFVPTGVVVRELATYKTNSEFGRMIAAYKPTDKDLLGKLPDHNWVLAGGGHNLPGIKKAVSLYLDMMDSALEMSPVGGLGQYRAKFSKLTEDMTKEIDTLQFVIGGAAQGNGMFGMTCVMEGDSAKKITGVMKSGTELIDELINKKFGQMDPSTAMPKISYVEDNAEIDAGKLDVIDITHPELAGMSEQERGMMKKVLGEDRIRFYVAQADKNTAVVTMGGSTQQMAVSLKSAKAGTGSIMNSRWMTVPKQYLPKKPAMIMVFNGSNLFDLIISGMKKVAPEAELPAGRISCRTPVAMGIALEDDTAKSVIYVPTKLVKDSVVLFLSMQGGGGGGGGAGPMGPGGF